MQERFENGQASNGGGFPLSMWISMATANNTLTNGLFLDKVAYIINWHLDYDLGGEDIRAWEAGALLIDGKNNTFAMKGAGNTPTGQADMYVRVDGYDVTPMYRRAKASTADNHPPVPYTCSDTAQP
jgi:hypothetical protein